MSYRLAINTFVLSVATVSLVIAAEPREVNYDEAQVPKFELAHPLVMLNGDQVENPQTWFQKRRPEIMRLFEEHVYGRVPNVPVSQKASLRSIDKNALGGTAIRKEVSIYFDADNPRPRMDLLIFLPKHIRQPVPVFLGLNFEGNRAVHADPGISLSDQWMRDGVGVVDNRATEASRGATARRWAIEKVIARGYGVVTIYSGDLDPDYDDEFQNGVQPLFYREGQAKPAPHEWGTIGAWAWGLSRAMDYLQEDAAINEKQVALLGHSRLGKTALWAGAQDPRFAIVISNSSGCGGAALSKRRFGETVEIINTAFPHWFCDNFVKYNGNEDALPVDQHLLVALIAPRPVYINSATDDQWADPYGEFLAAKYAEPVYRLLGTDGINGAEMPAADNPVMHTLGYHLRTGAHEVTDYDWDCYLMFADMHFNR